jgi:hypothetical protein
MPDAVQRPTVDGTSVRAVLTVSEVSARMLDALIGRFGIEIVRVPARSRIPGSFWGEPEAGVAGRAVFVRNDTPMHSLLHETCHIVCMSPNRRACLDRDAGGDDTEEEAVCFLQIVLAGCLASVGSARILRDMDAWGYSFRLGSAYRWFSEDADDACHWLQRHGLIDQHRQPTFALRGG